MIDLKSLKTDSSVKAAGDVLGGFAVLDSGLYKMGVEMAYVDKSRGGAVGLHLHMKDNHGNMFRPTLWVTSGDAKGNKPTYTDRDGNEQFLPGMNVANALCQLTCGIDMPDMDIEEKVIKVYNFDSKQEEPTTKDVLMNLLSKKVIVGVLKQVVDVNQQDDNGNWVASGKTREENEMDKLFDFDTQRTISEINAEVKTAKFINKWAEKNKGNTRMKAKGATGGPSTGAPTAATASATPGLFEDDD